MGVSVCIHKSLAMLGLLPTNFMPWMPTGTSCLACPKELHEPEINDCFIVNVSVKA